MTSVPGQSRDQLGVLLHGLLQGSTELIVGDFVPDVLSDRLPNHTGYRPIFHEGQHTQPLVFSFVQAKSHALHHRFPPFGYLGIKIPQPGVRVKLRWKVVPGSRDWQGEATPAALAGTGSHSPGVQPGFPLFKPTMAQSALCLQQMNFPLAESELPQQAYFDNETQCLTQTK